MSRVVGFGGTISYRCLNCGNSGLIGYSGLEGFAYMFFLLLITYEIQLKKMFVIELKIKFIKKAVWKEGYLMDKEIALEVKEVVAYHSVGYSPRFLRCPSCATSIDKSWDKPERCSRCNQKLLWSKN